MPRLNQRHHAFHHPAEAHHHSDEHCQHGAGQGRILQHDHATDCQQQADQNVKHAPASRQTELHNCGDDTDHPGNHEIRAQRNRGDLQRHPRPDE